MKLLFLLFSITLMHTCLGQIQIRLEEAKEHIGDSVQVSGKVSSIKYAPLAKNTPLFINIGGKYPNQLLTVVIWNASKKELRYDLDSRLSQATMSVAGRLELYNDKLQIVIHDAKQLNFYYEDVKLSGQFP